MNEQPEALRLANELDGLSQPVAWDAAAELRRLHAENEKLRAAMEQQEPVAWLHQCRKRPDLVELSFRKFEPALVAKGYKSRHLIFGDAAHQLHKREPLTNEQVKAGLIHSIEYTDARERCAFNIGVRFAEHAHGIK